MKGIMFVIHDVNLIWCWLLWWTCYWSILLYQVMTTYVNSYMKQKFTCGLPSYLLGCVGLYVKWLYENMSLIISFFILMESLTCICSKVCALRHLYDLACQRYDKWPFFMHVLKCYVHLPMPSIFGVLNPLHYITTKIESGHWRLRGRLKKLGTLSPSVCRPHFRGC